MSMQDPVADMLTRIRNAAMASMSEVKLPVSKLKNSIAAVLKDEGYIQDFKVEGEGIKKELVIQLKYHQNKPVIEGLKRISKPSCKVYCRCSDIPKVRNGLGTVIVSTSRGIVTGRKARKENIGGEILCSIW